MATLNSALQGLLLRQGAGRARHARFAFYAGFAAQLPNLYRSPTFTGERSLWRAISSFGFHYYMTSTAQAPTSPQVAINDIGDADDFMAAIDKTIKYFN